MLTVVDHLFFVYMLCQRYPKLICVIYLGIKSFKNYYITWNHRLFIILLSRNIGSTHTAPNVHDNNDRVHNQIFSLKFPNVNAMIEPKAGSIIYSKINILKQKMPPFNVQHWKIRCNIFWSLENKQQQNMYNAKRMGLRKLGRKISYFLLLGF